MEPEIRRIVAVDAHRRRTGDCPVLVHALGTGESFSIVPRPDGFADVQTGLVVRIEGSRIHLPGSAPIEIVLDGDIGFSGADPASASRFSGRAGGGSTVTIYTGDDFFQYAVLTAAEQHIINDHLATAERI